MAFSDRELGAVGTITHVCSLKEKGSGLWEVKVHSTDVNLKVIGEVKMKMP